jgi:hypothetical protein
MASSGCMTAAAPPAASSHDPSPLPLATATARAALSSAARSQGLTLVYMSA